MSASVRPSIPLIHPTDAMCPAYMPQCHTATFSNNLIVDSLSSINIIRMFPNVFHALVSRYVKQMTLCLDIVCWQNSEIIVLGSFGFEARGGTYVLHYQALWAFVSYNPCLCFNTCNIEIASIRRAVSTAVSSLSVELCDTTVCFFDT